LRSRTAGPKDVMRGMVDEGRGVGQRFERLKRVDQAVDGGAARGLPTIEPRQRACASGKRCRFVSETINRCADAGTTPEGCPQHGTAFHGRDSTPWPMLYGETLAPRMKVQPDRDRAAKLKPCVVAMEACCGALEEPRSRAAVAAEACPLPPSLPADHGCNPPNCTPIPSGSLTWKLVLALPLYCKPLCGQQAHPGCGTSGLIQAGNDPPRPVRLLREHRAGPCGRSAAKCKRSAFGCGEQLAASRRPADSTS